MPSVSYRRWRTVRRAALDLVEAAHATIHGTGAGRREATRQLNHGYTVLLATEFQGFCRELHTESVQHFVANLAAAQQPIVEEALTFNRQVDHGNANPGTLGSDFGRFGFRWWPVVDSVDADGPALRQNLEEMNNWRNAIAHNNFDPAVLGVTIRLMFAKVREWRRTCNRLARAFDQVLASQLVSCTGRRPW
jgi:hypothetical protein